MKRHHGIVACAGLALLLGLASAPHAQQNAPPPEPPPDNSAAGNADNDTVFRVNVDMVQLNVAVIDKKGNYVTGLNPSDFEILEDKTPQKMATLPSLDSYSATFLNRSPKQTTQEGRHSRTLQRQATWHSSNF